MVVVGGVDVLVDGVIIVVDTSHAAIGVPETRVAAVLGPDRSRRTLLEAGRVGRLVILGDVVAGVIRQSAGWKSEIGRKCQTRNRFMCSTLRIQIPF